MYLDQTILRIALRTILYTLCSLLFTPCSVLLAQEKDTTYNLPLINVTPTQATERSSPVTFSNVSREVIQQRQSLLDIPTLLSELPSVTTYSENGNGIGYNYMTLRGFDQRRLSIMVNGIPQNDPEDHNVYWIDFPDMLSSTDNIQVQRGAGSAFYGPAAIGGSVNLTTTPFTSTQNIVLESSFNVQEFGDENTTKLNARKYSAAYNSGILVDKYLFYGKLSRLSSDGYRERSFANLNSFFFAAARFDENMSTRVQFYGGPIEDGLVYYGLPKLANSDKKLRRQNLTGYWWGNNFIWTGPRRKEEIENFHQPHFELLNEWNISPTLKFCNTLFYVQGDGFFDYDGSWADTSMLRLGYNYGIPISNNLTNVLIRAFVGNKQFGYLPRMEIEHDNGTMTIGAEIRIHRSLHWGKIKSAEGFLPALYDLNYHFYEYNGGKNIFSLYAHELYRVEKNTTVMGDVQFVFNQYEIRNEKYLKNEFSVPYFFINPRFGINYNMSDVSNVYASLSYTSREPRLRNLYAAEDSYFGATPQFEIKKIVNGVPQYDFTSPLAKPEHLLNFEYGLQYKTASSYLKVNFYWMEFFDELVKSGAIDIFGQPVTGNAKRTRHIGMEYDGSQKLNEHFSAAGNLSLSRNRLIQYSTYENGVEDKLDGNPIAGFPNVLGNLRLTYRAEQLTTSLLSKYVGSFYTDNFRNEENKNDAYSVFNLETSYAFKFNGGVLTFRGEVRNIFNRLYFMSGEGNAFFPAAERNYLLGVTANL
ncbi:MAG: TonB-dependent receptor [Ignavibacteriales bacterium]|nr:TonB-dependent receptor [Ignavibacteriales bacterium]